MKLFAVVVSMVAAAVCVCIAAMHFHGVSRQVPRDSDVQERRSPPPESGAASAETHPDLLPPDRQPAVKLEIDALKKESFEIAQALLQDFPGESDALGLMGMLYDRCHQEAKAWEYWEKAMDLNPNRPDLYYTMVTIALRRGEHEKAAELCRKGLEKFAQMPQLHYQRAEALNGLGRAAESVGELQTAIRLAPEIGEYHRLLGKTYALLNEHEKARLSYQTAIELQPRNALAHYGLAIACAKLGMEHESERAMEQYQKFRAEDLETQQRRADVSYDIRWHRRNLAITCADAGTIYMAKGMTAKAEPLLRRGVEVDSEYTGCRAQLVELLCRTQRLREAVPLLRQLIEIEPPNAGFHLRLAVTCGQLGQFDEALAAARKAVELAPNNPECRRVLGQLQAKK